MTDIDTVDEDKWDNDLCNAVEDMGLTVALELLVTWCHHKSKENSVVYYSNLFKVAGEALDEALDKIHLAM